ncbi:uncharacterized protein LOC119085156 [Bradysia coprophila]|uniref:uncharacterized protein LOC119085156 n=1 Tax=Bradysia coprophila TaxID=38358 RepID=UPI00187D926F|nr:uncharacterized protein LOC119085156 [Bradysia coprophila]
MGVPLTIGILFTLVVIILPQSTTAIKCFQCRDESDCGSDHYFRSDFEHKIDKFVNEGCSFNPEYIPACKYVINKSSVVRERGCGGVGVTSRQTFCKNRYADVVECYCTTDWCNGIDASNTAVSAAEEHFRRLEAAKQAENKVQTGGASHTTFSMFGIALIIALSLICG